METDEDGNVRGRTDLTKYQEDKREDEENERLEILLTQRDDLLESEENLRETIRKIDKVARKRFQETFDMIKTNFENYFNYFSKEVLLR